MSDKHTFTISRTSRFIDSEVRPHLKAYAGSFVSYEYWTFKTVREAEKRYPDKEFEKVNGSVRSVGVDKDCWLIDFSDLDELVAFSDEVGEIIVGANFRNHDQPHIEIYDGYRE